MPFRRAPIAATAAIVMLVVAGCNPDAGGGAATADRELDHAIIDAAKDSTRQAPAPSIDGAQKGGTVTVNSGYGASTFDPTEAYYTSTVSILSGLVTRSLTQYAYDPNTGTMVLVPDLATDLGTPNNDYTTWTFTLREGVTWEKGQLVTPQDVKYGIERSFDRTTFPGGAGYSNEYFLNGETYKGPYENGADYDGVVIDGSKITIKMAHPFPDMPYWGAFPAMGPIPAGQPSTPSKYALHPWATGPYRFADYVPGESLTLVRNLQWDPTTDPARHAYPKKYVFRFTEDSAQTDQTILDGDGAGEATLTYDNVLASDYQVAVSTSSTQLATGSSQCTRMWEPDYRTITDINVRRAIGYAFPYRDVWAARGDIAGVTRLPGTSIMAPDVPGRQRYNPLSVEAASYDPEKAKQLLAAAGYQPGQFELKFAYLTDDPSQQDVKNALIKGLTRAGFEATPVRTTINEYSALRGDPNYHAINVREYGWCSDWPSGGAVIPPLFSSKYRGETNLAWFREPEVDQRIRQIELLPLSQQPAAWGRLDRMIEEKYYPVVNTGYIGIAMLHGTSIMGMNSDGLLAMPTWKDMWVRR